MKKINEVLKKQLSIITPSSQEMRILTLEISSIVFKINSELRKIDAFAIIGGSFAKGTIIRTRRYDLDVFARFNYEKYKNRDKEISGILLNVLKKLNRNNAFQIELLHGSRDYFRIHLKNAEKLIHIPIYMEIVPVLSIGKTEDALNVTDVSPLHVLYVLDKIKKGRNIADSIKIAKSFCYGQGCYGAESHIRGFSGYCLELLCLHFGSFINLLKAASKWNIKEKTIIDIPKFYKSKNMIMIEMNEAKIVSPLIVVDPVQPDRNAAAAISSEKLEIFAKASKSFLKNPSLSFFVKKEITKEEMKKLAGKKKKSLIVIEAGSIKEKEDVAGAKLFKLFSMLLKKFKKEGKVEGKWKYDEDGRKAEFFFLFKPEKSIILRGPPVKLEQNVKQFRKKWKKTFIKSGIVCSQRKSKSIKEIIAIPKEQLDEMGIKGLKLVK